MIEKNTNYIEYPIADHGFTTICEITEEEAEKLAWQSKYYSKLTYYQRGGSEKGLGGVSLMNKGAVRLAHEGLWLYRHDFKWKLIREPNTTTNTEN